MPYKDKAKRYLYNATPEAKAKRAAYYATPEAKAKKAAYSITPEVKVRKAASAAIYNAKSEVKVKTKARIRNIRRLKNGWTPEMFEQTLLEQGNVCAVCREPFTDKDAACADHKHVNPPEPRGLLHQRYSLGMAVQSLCPPV